jgi:hypothetical protein
MRVTHARCLAEAFWTPDLLGIVQQVRCRPLQAFPTLQPHNSDTTQPPTPSRNHATPRVPVGGPSFDWRRYSRCAVCPAEPLPSGTHHCCAAAAAAVLLPLSPS